MTEPKQRPIPDILTELAELYALLPHLLTSRPPTDTAGVRRPPSSKPPLRLDVLHLANLTPRYHGDAPEALDDMNRQPCGHAPAPDGKPCPCRDSAGIQGLLPDLWVEARGIAYELEIHDPQLPEELPEYPTMASVTAWLIQHWDRYVELCPREAELSAKDIRRMHRQLRHIAGEREPYQPRHTGHDGCGWPITATHTDDGELAYFVCSGCGATFNHHAELQRLAQLQAPVTLAEVAAMAKVTLRTAQRWVESGDLLPITAKGERPARFRVMDVRRVARRVG